VSTPEPRWERLAREDAEFYIRTETTDYTAPGAMDEFFRSGEADVEQIMREVAPWLGERRDAALEIGCGVGRLTLPSARRFGRVVAVDIAPTMLRKLGENAARAGLANVEGFTPDQPYWERGPVDLAYSRWVLQHIPEFEVIEEYIRRVAQALHPQGVAHLQFDTRPATLPYRVRNVLPDFLLRRTWRRGIRRIRRTPELLAATFARHGLRVVHEIGSRQEEHVFILTR
jgi:cyclopropane fatty-acyl-phospholipid synthase-like methyltransferase